MIREGLERFSRLAASSGPVHPAALEFGARSFPHALQAFLTEDLETRSSKAPFVDSRAIQVISRPTTRVPRSITIRDRRMAGPGPHAVVKYLFSRDGSEIFLGLFLARAAGSQVRQVGLRIMSSYLVPRHFDWSGKAARGTSPDQFQRATIPSRHKRSVLFVRAFEVSNLPDEEELTSALVQITLLFQQIVYATARPADPSRGMGFHRQTPVFPEPTSARTYTVWFGTNREPPLREDGSLSGAFDFADIRSSKMWYGTCTVNIPEAHKFGSVGSSFWRRLLSGVDDRLTVRKRELLLSEQAFADALRAHVQAIEPDLRHVLVYIHGYNVSFNDAAIRAAQLGADLNIATTAFFSWPSKARLQEYFADEAAIEASESFIAQFLSTIASVTEAQRVHVIAHSMGNRGFLRAMHKLVAHATSAGIRFGQVLLAAPDVDAQLFGELALIYPKVSQRSTLYVCARDKALEASSWLHSYQRAGFTPPTTIVPGIDTVEVTNLDLTMLGHSYFGEAAAVLYDMFTLIRSNLAPENRQRLVPLQSDSSARYWLIRG